MNSTETLNRKRKELQKLLFLVYRAKEKKMLLFISNNPRSHSALISSLVFTACILVPCALADVNDWVFGLLSIAVPVSSFIFFRKKSTAGETWQEEFDNKLMDYDPVDLHNFKWLQNATEKYGSIDYDILRDWIYMESSAIKDLLYPKSEKKPAIEKIRTVTQSKKLRFIERNL